MSRLAPNRIALCAAAAGACALLALPAAAAAQSPSVSVHALFSGGRTTNFMVGTPLRVQYNDPSGQTREEEVCWSPSTITQPACTPTGTGAPASTGTQNITVELTNGKSVSTSVSVAAAATQLGSGTTNSPPVPYTVTCSDELYGNANQSDPISLLSPGEQVAAYYKANSSTLQVYDYATNTPGFAASNCLTGPAQKPREYSDTFRLRSNQTRTYRLSLPSGFQPYSIGGSTTYGWQLYPGSQYGSGAGDDVPTKPSRFVHRSVLGATVIGTSISNNKVSVRVRTTRLERPMTLFISAIGTT
jgi:hypothetical protein